VYTFDLPVQAIAGFDQNNVTALAQRSTGVVYRGVGRILASSSKVDRLYFVDNSGSTINTTAPWGANWANGDSLWIDFDYFTA